MNAFGKPEEVAARRMDGVGRSELRDRNDTFRRRRHDALSVSAGVKIILISHFNVTFFF